jgi:hypothetical protein
VLLAIAKSETNIGALLPPIVDKVWFAYCLAPLAFRASIVSIKHPDHTYVTLYFDSMISRMSLCDHEICVFGVGVYIF